MSLIYLTGMSGAGKTSAGELLAKRLGIPFIDLDAEIEESEEMSIPEIFERFGEEHFRNAESKILTMFSESPRSVVALGAGALERKQNADLVRRTGQLIYLRAEIDLLISRIRDIKERPMLSSANTEEKLRERMAGLLQQREAQYLSAHIVVNIDVDDSLSTLR